MNTAAIPGESVDRRMVGSIQAISFNSIKINGVYWFGGKELNHLRVHFLFTPFHRVFSTLIMLIIGAILIKRLISVQFDK